MLLPAIFILTISNFTCTKLISWSHFLSLNLLFSLCLSISIQHLYPSSYLNPKCRFYPHSLILSLWPDHQQITSLTSNTYPKCNNFFPFTILPPMQPKVTISSYLEYCSSSSPFFHSLHKFIPSAASSGVYKTTFSLCHQPSIGFPLHLNKTQTPNAGLYNLFICQIFHHSLPCSECSRPGFTAYLLTYPIHHHLWVVGVPLLGTLFQASFLLFNSLVILYDILSERLSV